MHQLTIQPKQLYIISEIVNYIAVITGKMNISGKKNFAIPNSIFTKSISRTCCLKNKNKLDPKACNGTLLLGIAMLPGVVS